MRWISGRAAGFFILILLPALVSASSVDEIRALLDSGDATAAWQLAAERADSESGDPRFDLWLGIAALEAGHADRAVFALERSLLVEPRNHRARLELGRAFYSLGNQVAARREFERVLAQDPPPNVRSRVAKFITALDRLDQSLKTTYSGYVGLRSGIDSNINSATADSRVDIPALGEVLLDDAGRETEDEFVEMEAGFELQQALTKFSGVFASASLRHRENVSDEDFDLGVASLRAGVVAAVGRDRLRVPVTWQKLFLSQDSYRTLKSVGVEWLRQLDPANQWTLFGQAGQFRYSENTSLDVDLKLAGAAWMHRWTQASLLVASSLYAGNERAENRAAEHNGKAYYGARLGLEWQRWARHQPFVSATFQAAEYDANDPVFGTRREDDFLELRLGWVWNLRPAWKASAEYSAIRNTSNIDLYEYDRDQVTAGVRYDF